MSFMNIERWLATVLLVIGLISADAQVSKALCMPQVPKAGDVLVAGGEDFNENATNQSEFFDPGTGNWVTTCPASVRGTTKLKL
jgi:hypothetical protein